MTKDEALKLALEALEEINKLSVGENAICLPAEIDTAMDACRKVLAQPEQEPVAWSYWQSCLNDDGTQTAPWVHRLSKFKPNESIINKDIVPLYTTPPQLEPVIDKSAAIRIATSLGWEPKRTWLGLTEDEFKQIMLDTYNIDLNVPGHSSDDHLLWRAIEAKLKEKNT